VAEDVAARANGRLGFVYDRVLQGFSITMPRAAVAGIARDPRVDYVEEDIPVTAFAQTTPTGVRRIFANTTDLSLDQTDDMRVDVDVAVLDTGIDYEHPELNVVGGANCLNYVRNGWRVTYYCDEAVSSDDDHYHGTHVAGTIGAIDNGSGVVGVAPGARLWAVKVLDNNGSGSLSGIIAGIDWVAANGDIEVINMSLGGGGFSSAMNTAVYNAVQDGVTVVVAAGNSNQNAANFTPANAPDAITVSALADFNGAPGGGAAPTCRTDQDDTLADFSNWGATVDIAAPGVCIYSTYPLEKGSFNTISGTSMASPHVAGAAALLASNGLTPAEIRAALVSKGNLNWVDDSGDGIKERLLDISNGIFAPVLIPTGGGGPVNNAPTASFGVSCNNLACSFDGTASSDPDLSDTLSYAWSFGDGTTDTSTGAIVNHTYAAAGTYTAGLTVTDDGAGPLSDSTTRTFSVTAGGGGGTPGDACDGLSNGLHFTSTSDNNGKTWTANVDVLKCSGGDPAAFGNMNATWNPDFGGGNCVGSEIGMCTATQSGIPKKNGKSRSRLTADRQRSSSPDASPRAGLSGARRFGLTRAPHPLPSSSARSSLRDSLPTEVRGSASRNSRCWGNSCRPSRSFRNSRNSSSVKGAAPSRNVTNALAASPRYSSGTPITIHSPTAGCS
jgi:PKD repeat protein